MQKHFGWQDGLPTAPDVQSMVDSWPDLKIKDRVEYEEVAALLKVKIGGARWRSITNQWRKRMREKGLVIECDVSRAFYVATAEQISSQTYGCLRFISRKARGHRSKLALARPGTSSLQIVIEHQAMLMLAVERDAKKARLKVLPSTAIPPILAL